MKKWIVILIAVLFTACKTSKEFSEVSELTSETKTDVSERVRAESTTNTAVYTVMSCNDSEKVVENVLITEYSLPDTAGKQYVIKTTKITSSKEKHNQLLKTDAKQQTIDALRMASKEDKSETITKEDTVIESKISTKTKTPGWVYPLAIISVLGLLFFTYLFLKRYKIL